MQPLLGLNGALSIFFFFKHHISHFTMLLHTVYLTLQPPVFRENHHKASLKFLLKSQLKKKEKASDKRSFF